MDTPFSSIALGAGAATAIMWAIQTVRHRAHLGQRVQDLQRHQRLSKRLIGCVIELERMLDDIPTSSSPGTVPERLAGHARFLYGLRREAGDNVIHLSRHAVRLRWPDVYLARTTLAGRRCELAHGALVTAFQSLSDAAREYEQGLVTALEGTRQDQVLAPPLKATLRLLDETSADHVARLRETCERALIHAADACNLGVRSHTVFDTTWPVRRSEVAAILGDPYQGEVRPLLWTGLGPQPLLHVDAR